MPDKNITGWYCTTQLGHDNEQSAWEEYIQQFIHLCTWLRGFKYWRVKPEVNSQINFDTNKTMFRIYSRLILSINEFPTNEIEQANFKYDGIEYKWSDYN